ncbi:MAG TPA: NAD(P)/FAD-dependent oxidoreductase [Thermoanaerobaculia bacterium]|nr:NAD(P)/FAD-dependent oxidoreductase [Thermoanaerobaculia bacterium]HXK69115.1 NAD(P)/FAD-dependent oxidoreductase [Thermoanaerobaculia bacterium]
MATIAVIGGGVSGLICAGRLAGWDHDVTLFERGSSPGIRSVCGGAFATEILSKYEINAPHIPVSRAILETFTGEPLIEMEPVPLVLTRREILDQSLAAWAVSRGVSLRTSSTVTGCDETENRVHIRVRNAIHEAEYAVFADGPRTMAPGIGYQPGPATALALTWRVEAEDSAGDATFFVDPSILPSGYGWVFSLDHMVNAGIGCLYRHLPGIKLKEILNQYLLHRYKHCSIQSRRAGLIPTMMPSRLATNRIAVVGDAAGMVNPVTGGGIYFAARGAELLARAIHRSAQTGRPLVSTYYRNLRISPAFFALYLLQKAYTALSRIPSDRLLEHYFRLSALSVNKLLNRV